MKSTELKYRRITFRITTDAPLPVGEQVFVSGNLPSLGEWSADGLPLTRVDDTIWSGSVDVPTNDRVEFKITRGAWDREALGTEVPARNLLIPPGSRDLTVNHFVTGWLDRVPA